MKLQKFVPCCLGLLLLSTNLLAKSDNISSAIQEHLQVEKIVIKLECKNEGNLMLNSDFKVTTETINLRVGQKMYLLVDFNSDMGSGRTCNFNKITWDQDSSLKNNPTLSYEYDKLGWNFWSSPGPIIFEAKNSGKINVPYQVDVSTYTHNNDRTGVLDITVPVEVQ
ncbi:MAG: hypothetical protein ACOYK6_01275 [Chthoniobacterales bacterium]